MVRLRGGIAPEEIAAVADALTLGFSDYAVPMRFTETSLHQLAESDDIELDASCLLVDDGGAMVGVGLGALRGATGRVAAMGVVPDHRRQGAGERLGRWLLGALTERGADRVVLEALTTNTPALALYEHLGLRPRRRLVGFEGRPGGWNLTADAVRAALAEPGEPPSWQLERVIEAAVAAGGRAAIPAVVPERHAVAALLAGAGLRRSPIEQFELATKSA